MLGFLITLVTGSASCNAAFDSVDQKDIYSFIEHFKPPQSFLFSKFGRINRYIGVLRATCGKTTENFGRSGTNGGKLSGIPGSIMARKNFVPPFSAAKAESYTSHKRSYRGLH